MQSYNQEVTQDKYCPPSRSDINIDSVNISKDMGLGGWVLKRLYSDFIFGEYIDVHENGLIEDEDGLVSTVSDRQPWRKVRILMISDVIEPFSQAKVGDIVLFPDDKGLKTGNVSYLDKNGEVKQTKYGVFFNERKIFCQIENECK